MPRFSVESLPPQRTLENRELKSAEPGTGRGVRGLRLSHAAGSGLGGGVENSLDSEACASTL